MTTGSTNILDIAKTFIKAIEEGKTGDALAEFYSEKVIQVEYPNTLTRNLTARTLKDLQEASERGKKVMAKQQYDIVKSYVYGNTVILEAVWTGTLAITIGNLPAGGEMKAYFAQFFEFEDGKIIRQRNYDCFEPFS